MKRLFFATPVIAMILVGGCQAARDANDASYQLRKDKTGPHTMSNRTTLDLNQNRFDGNDIQNQNPNFLNLNGTRNGMASGGSGNHATDTEQAKWVINKTKEFRAESIWIDRHYMHVSVSEKRKMSSHERRTAKANLHRKLLQALPRYSNDIKTIKK